MSHASAQPKLRHLPFIAGLFHHRHRHRRPVDLYAEVNSSRSFKKLRADFSKVKPMPIGLALFLIGLLPVMGALCAFLPTPKSDPSRSPGAILSHPPAGARHTP